MKNTLDDLRNHLFEVIEALKDPDEPMDIAQALAVGKVADRLIAAAKLEVEALKIVDAEPSDFLLSRKPGPRRLTEGRG